MGSLLSDGGMLFHGVNYITFLIDLVKVSNGVNMG